MDGEYGYAKSLAMKILVKLGELKGADKLIEISSAHISGISYKNIGDYGIEFLEEILNNERFSIPTTINPSGVDRYNLLGVDENFYKKQMHIIKLFEKAGAIVTCTCTPYLIGNIPYNQHVAFAESSLTIFANSVLKAYTNRESSISSLAAAIIGKVPNYGMHKEENRRPEIRIIVEEKIKNEDYYYLGYYIGINLGKIPLIENVHPNIDELKYLSAGLSISDINIFHIKEKGKNFDEEYLEKIRIEKKELYEIREKFKIEDFDVLCLGCPHLSLREIHEILRRNIKHEVILFTNFYYYEMFKNKVPENVKLIPDTCMVVAPIKYKRIATNSIKACYYLRNQGISSGIFEVF